MLVLQREATTAMLSVEDQQQELTYQKLLTMVKNSNYRFSILVSSIMLRRVFAVWYLHVKGLLATRVPDVSLHAAVLDAGSAGLLAYGLPCWVPMLLPCMGANAISLHD